MPLFCKLLWIQLNIKIKERKTHKSKASGICKKIVIDPFSEPNIILLHNDYITSYYSINKVFNIIVNLVSFRNFVNFYAFVF